MNPIISLKPGEEEVDALEWDPNNPTKKKLKKHARRYSFEHPSSASTRK